MKRPDGKNKGSFVFPSDECPVCQKKLFIRQEKIVEAILIGSETITDVNTASKQCNMCRNTVRHNLVTLGKELVNTMSLEEMRTTGAFFVTSKTAFSIPFLELTYLRFLRGKLAPGQEAAVLQLYHVGDDRLPTGRRLRELLLRALEGFAVAQRTPKQASNFNMAYPAAHLTKMDKVLLFPPSDAVDAICFDGHFGIHRGLCPVDQPRTVRLKGHPRKKILREHDRSCTCRSKDSIRVVLPQRTAGWHFAVDPSSRRVLGVVEHVQNENNKDKVRLLKAVMNMDQVEADLLIHDDICHFQQYASRKKHATDFNSSRYYVVDAFHAPNHRCSKSTWTPAERRRCRNVRTNVSESFNAWVRSLNFFLNNLRPKSHRFWVEEMCNFNNNNLQSVPIRISRRRNVRGRAKKMLKRPAAVQMLKRPAAVQMLKRPAAIQKRPASSR
ncbi:unnamed protein product [Symbiodinium sp. CCMP2592]|nr:unnamed protein product [Symbiodinium sp. CCMP2592]